MSDEKDFGLDGQWGEAYPAGAAEPAAPSAGEDPDAEIIDLDFSSGTDEKEEGGADSGQADFSERDSLTAAGEDVSAEPGDGSPAGGIPEGNASASGSMDGGAAAAGSMDGDAPSSGADPGADEMPGSGAGSGPVHGFSPKTGPGSGGEYDWEEDEPKYDTQTGERLDRPKPKWPGIVLTAVVSVATLGALIYSSIPGTVKETQTVQTSDDADTETEGAVLSISDGSRTEETEGAVLSISDGSRTEESEGAVLSISDGSGTEETEGIAPSYQQTAAAAETEEEAAAAEVIKEDGASDYSSLTDIVQAVMPCVVSVTAASPETVSAYYEGEGSLENVPFCSGFVVQEDDENLYVLTDRQIAVDEQDLTVGFASEGQEAAGGLAKAVLTGTDEETSLALLKVEKSGIAPEILETAQMAQINAEGQALVGESVALVGKTVSYGQSVMQGIICAVSAQMDTVYGKSEYILTDIPVNALNNGGPLVNMAGEVIGIASSDPAGDRADGMSRILPFQEAVQALDRINGANQAQALLSAVMPAGDLEETEEEAAKEDAAASDQVAEETEAPAEEDVKAAEEETGAAGENAGAVITAGTAEDEPEKDSVSGKTAGSEPEAADRTGNAVQGGQLGIHVSEINDERQIIDRLPAGVYIADVISDSGAWAAGLAAGDVIVGLGGRQTLSLEELREVLAAAKAGDKIQVSYLRPDDRGRYNEKRVRRTLVTLS